MGSLTTVCRSEACNRLRPTWLIPTHQNSKLLLISRYTKVIHILFLKLI